MATLELAIDATKAQQGAQVAEQAMTRVTKAAEGTGKAVQDAGAKMSAAFQATGGSIQIAGGLAQTAKAFGELNVQAGLFNSSRLLLEIGKTAQDFRELSAGVTGVSGAFGVLSTIIKANPLLAAATAIGTIASAIGLFASETDKATESYRKFGDSLRELRIDAQTAAYLGIAGPGAGAQAQRLIEASRTAQQGGQGINIREFQGTELDRRAAEIAQRQLAGTYQGGLLAEFQATGGTTRFGGARGERQIFTPGLPDIQLTQQQTQELLRELFQETQKQLDAEKASAAAADQAAKARQQIAEKLQEQAESPYIQFGAGPEFDPRSWRTRMPTVGLPGGPLRGAEYQYAGGRLRSQYQAAPGEAPPLIARPEQMTPNYGTMAGGYALPNIGDAAIQAAMVAKQAVDYQKRITELKAEEARYAEQAANYAGQLGASVGSAFADVLMKTTTLRQAFASIVASFARQGLSDVGSAIFRGAVSGLTSQQSANNQPAKT